MKKIKNHLKAIPGRVWILGIIILVGIFLRTYSFHDWLYFYPDQARDVMIVDDALSGRTPWPLLGAIAASTPFKLGPMYYYFQIISAKIFGSSPTTVAYPDLFFGVLTIPLLYYFLKKMISSNAALMMSGLYAVSFYAIRYSRFAWNSNPIPFFTLLFLLSLSEVAIKREKLHWIWVALLGISIGVGIQLHTVMLILLPATAFFAFVYTIKKNPKVFVKWIFIALIVAILNIGQFVSESRTNFQNTKDFISTLQGRSVYEKSSFSENLEIDVICYSQANTLFLSSLINRDPCFEVTDFRSGSRGYTQSQLAMVRAVAVGFLIMILGYATLAFRFKKTEDENKKIFLGLVGIYGLICFLVLLPAIGVNGQVRYWLPVIFMPFLFLGFLVDFLLERKAKIFSILVVLLMVSLVWINFSTIYSEAKQFDAKNRSNKRYVVLGEIEPMMDFIKKESASSKQVYIFVDNTDYFWNYFKPLLYVGGQNGLEIIRAKKPENVPVDAPLFIVGAFDNQEYIAGKTERSVEKFENFGNIGIYKLKN